MIELINLSAEPASASIPIISCQFIFSFLTVLSPAYHFKWLVKIGIFKLFSICYWSYFIMAFYIFSSIGIIDKWAPRSFSCGPVISILLSFFWHWISIYLRWKPVLIEVSRGDADGDNTGLVTLKVAWLMAKRCFDDMKWWDATSQRYRRYSPSAASIFH